jgi:hypothetical protein
MTDRPATFRHIAPDGSEIATGRLDFLNKQLEAHRTAEGAIRAAALAADARHRARADELQAREDAVAARELALKADAFIKLTDGLRSLSARMDAFEERQEQERIADEIREADEALKALQADDGPLQATLSAPEPEKQECEVQIQLEPTRVLGRG